MSLREDRRLSGSRCRTLPTGSDSSYPMSRFVDDVERAPTRVPLQLGRKLDALGLATGEFGRRLT